MFTLLLELGLGIRVSQIAWRVAFYEFNFNKNDAICIGSLIALSSFHSYTSYYQHMNLNILKVIKE